MHLSHFVEASTYSQCKRASCLQCVLILSRRSRRVGSVDTDRRSSDVDCWLNAEFFYERRILQNNILYFEKTRLFNLLLKSTWKVIILPRHLAIGVPLVTVLEQTLQSRALPHRGDCSLRGNAFPRDRSGSIYSSALTLVFSVSSLALWYKWSRLSCFTREPLWAFFPCAITYSHLTNKNELYYPTCGLFRSPSFCK